MGFKSILKKAAQVGLNQGLPIASAFGVPGAALVHDAVKEIQDDDKRSNDDATLLTAAAVDELDARIDTLESAFVGQNNRITALETRIAELNKLAARAEKILPK